MGISPLKSLREYSKFAAEIADRPSVRSSTVRVWSDSPFTGVATGEIFFTDGFRLRIREELDFDSGLITSYGYEAYRERERLYWYDDFPHPHDPNLAGTFPHHKHVHPDIKHNRIPAPELSFRQPNLPALIYEIEELVKHKKGI
jgi:hypothetical protein